MQPQNNQQQQQQQKAMIYIENLDQGISEDYLYRKFKEIGEIQSLKIAKDKTTQKSKGQAYITFANPDSAEEARKMFNNVVFIKNIIRVKAYFNYHNADKKANIFINSLPEDADTLELEQEFSRFGTVLSVDIHRDNNGKSLNYGYVQFEKKDEAENLMREVATKPFIYKTKVLKLESFKAQSERKTESAAIYLRAFARPLTEDENKDDKVLRAIEFAWTLIIKDYFLKQKAEVKDCFVKIDKFTRQPWAMIQFNCPEQSKENLDICERQRLHPCINGSAARAFELLHKVPPPSTSDGVHQFELQEVRSFFEEQIKSHQDVFLGKSDNFFYNQVYSKHLNPDDRLILVQNIKDDVTKEDIEQFLGAFGKVIRLTIRKTKNPRFQVQQCFVHYQTMEDSKRARSEVYDDSNTKVVELKKKIFKDGHVMMNILLSKAVRKEYKEIKKQSQSIFQNPQGRILLQPHPQYMPQMAPLPYPRQGGQQMMPRPPFNNRPYDQNRRQPGGRPQFQQYPQGSQMGQMQQMNPMQMNPMAQQMGYPPRQPQNHFMQQGGQRFPPQQPQFPGPYPQMPIQQNFPINMPPVQQQFNPIDKFQDYATVVECMNEFNQLQTKIQRDILGNLLVFKIAQMTTEQDQVNKIVGMLIEENQFDIGEILGFFEDERELQERIDEALELLRQSQNDSQP